MARYTGPACKICRRLGVKLMTKGDRCFGSKCAMDPSRRPFAPGPQSQRRRKVSEFGVQLREKQKARFIYGVLEKQFSRTFQEAARRSGSTGENLLLLLEGRLDNVVFRLGFGNSRRESRQMVRHGHFALNGRKTDIPSCLLKPGDMVSVLEASQKNDLFKIAMEDIGRKSIPTWLSIDAATMTGRVLSAPARADIDSNINEHLIVEYYSR